MDHKGSTVHLYSQPTAVLYGQGLQWNNCPIGHAGHRLIVKVTATSEPMVVTCAVQWVVTQNPTAKQEDRQCWVKYIWGIEHKQNKIFLQYFVQKCQCKFQVIIHIIQTLIFWHCVCDKKSTFLGITDEKCIWQYVNPDL